MKANVEERKTPMLNLCPGADGIRIMYSNLFANINDQSCIPNFARGAGLLMAHGDRQCRLSFLVCSLSPFDSPLTILESFKHHAACRTASSRIQGKNKLER